MGLQVTVAPLAMARPLFHNTPANCSGAVERHCGSTGVIDRVDTDGTVRVTFADGSLWFPCGALYAAAREAVSSTTTGVLSQVRMKRVLKRPG